MIRKSILNSFGIALLSVVNLATVCFAQQKTRTVTNFDLQRFREQRLQFESDYEKRRERDNLPSPQELDRRTAERLRFNQEFLQKAQIQQQQAESFYLSQAAALRSDLAALDAEINYVRVRVDEIPPPQVYYSVGYLPFIGFNGFGGFGGVGFPQFPNGSSSTTVTGGGISGGVSVGGNSRVTIGGGYNQTSVRQTGTFRTSPNGLQAPQVTLNSNGGFAAGNLPRNNLGATTNLFFGNVPYTAGLLSSEFTLPTTQNLTREELLVRLRTLEQARAGLRARFEVLEDEARRNGVKID